MKSKKSATIKESVSVEKLIKRPGVSLLELSKKKFLSFLGRFGPVVLEQVEIQTKYGSYIKKEKELVLKMNSLEKRRINSLFDYKKLSSLSSEAKDKLSLIRPKNLGQASRISGVSPADVAVLMVYLNNKRKK